MGDSVKRLLFKVRKKKNYILLILIFVLLGSCIIEAAVSIRLNCQTVTITEGKSYQLKVKGTKKKVKWSSSNKKVSTVSQKGLIKGKKAGRAVITAKIDGKKYSCKVTVKKVSIRLNKSRLTLYKGNSSYLKLNGTKQKPKWYSDAKNTVVVTSSGKVIGKEKGLAIISAVLNGKKYRCIVIVLDKEKSEGVMEAPKPSDLNVTLSPPTLSPLTTSAPEIETTLLPEKTNQPQPSPFVDVDEENRNPYLDKTGYASKEVTIGDINFVLPEDWMEKEDETNAEYKGYFPKDKEDNKIYSGILIGIWEENSFWNTEMLKQGVLREAEIQQDKIESHGYSVETLDIDTKMYESGTAILSRWKIKAPSGGMKEMILYDILINGKLVEVQIGNLKEEIGVDICRVGEDIIQSLRVIQ